MVTDVQDDQESEEARERQLLSPSKAAKDVALGARAPPPSRSGLAFRHRFINLIWDGSGGALRVADPLGLQPFPDLAIYRVERLFRRGFSPAMEPREECGAGESWSHGGQEKAMLDVRHEPGSRLSPGRMGTQHSFRWADPRWPGHMVALDGFPALCCMWSRTSRSPHGPIRQRQPNIPSPRSN